MKDLILVVDMQNVYSEGGEWHCKNFDAALDSIIKLIEGVKASKQDENIILTKFIADSNPVGVWKQYNLENARVNEDEFANKITDKLSKYEKLYPVYEKSTYSSLTVPQIMQAVDKIKDTGSVVVTGVVAECCVLFTITQLIDLGAKVVYLTDAVAGIDNETEAAVIKVLEGLTPLHVSCMTTKEYLDSIDIIK